MQIDAGASRFDIMRLIIVPLSKSGIALGSIFVASIVMGDFFVTKVMSGGGSASVVGPHGRGGNPAFQPARYRAAGHRDRIQMPGSRLDHRALQERLHRLDEGQHGPEGTDR
jgi:hypothetical protein